jgi:putative oxidoreductase
MLCRVMRDTGLLVLRLTLACVFVAHSMHKLFGFWAGPGVGPGGLPATAAHLASVGLQGGTAMAILAGGVQLLGGALVGVGLLTRYAASALLGYVIIGIWKEHFRWGLFLNWSGAQGRGNGLEYSIVLIGALVCLILAGSGRWSFDGRRAAHAESRAMGRARLRKH